MAMKNIQSTNRQRAAMGILNSWADVTLLLENKRSLQNYVVNNKDYRFLRLIGQGVYYLNSLNSLLVSEIDKYAGLLPHADPCYEELKGIAGYTRFFNSLIASKVKYFFFRETPIANTNNPFFRLDLDIYKSAINILNLLNEEVKCRDEIKFNICKYFYLQMLMYSFIYDRKKEKGVFLRFNYEYNNFTKIKEFILDRTSRLENEEQLRFLGTTFVCDITRYYVNNNNFISIDEFSPKSNVYSDLFNLYSGNNSPAIEPLSYHLCDIIWKIDAMVHNDSDFYDKKKKKLKDNEVIELVSKFIKDYLLISDKMYRDNKINYLNIYQIETEFIHSVYNKLLRERDICEIKENYKMIASFNRECRHVNDVTITYKTIYNVLKSEILAKLRFGDEKGFKIESIIQNLNKNELLLLFKLLSKIVPENLYKSETTAVVGFYKSGAFLAHIMNLIFGQEKQVWLFKSKPYVATHPIHKDGEVDCDSIIIFDESLKTGFTYSLYESYLLRNMPDVHLSTYLYSLFDFSIYSKIDLLRDINFLSLIKLNEKLIPTNEAELNFLCDSGDQQFILSFCEDLDLNPQIESLKKFNSDEGRLDVTLLLTNTNLLVNVCKKFVNTILEKLEVNSRKKIFLFSPSDDGAILCLMTAFILKILDKEVFLTNELPVHNNDLFLVAVDITFETGFSLAACWGGLSRGYYDPAEYMELISEIDLVCTIIGRESEFSNIQPIISI